MRCVLWRNFFSPWLLNRVNHWRNFLVTWSAEFYCGHIPALAIYVYICMHTHIFVHTHKYTHAYTHAHGFKDFWEHNWKNSSANRTSIYWMNWAQLVLFGYYHFIITQNSCLRWLLLLPHFTDEKTRGQRDYITCSHSCSYSVTESEFKSRSNRLQSQIHIRMTEAMGSTLLRGLTLKHCRIVSGPSLFQLVWGLWGQSVGT